MAEDFAEQNLTPLHFSAIDCEKTRNLSLKWGRTIMAQWLAALDMSSIITQLIIMAVAYLIGSINTAIIVGKLKSNIDIREHGSGNAGMTNAMRTMGKTSGILVLLGDVLKAVIVMTVTLVIFRDEPTYLYIAGAGAVLGHNFPIYFGFKGGKGVLVSLVAIMFAHPIIGLAALVISLVTMVIWRYVSLGSIVGAISTVAFAFMLELDGYLIAYFLFLAVLCLKMHSSNVVRLINGEENKIGVKK